MMETKMEHSNISIATDADAITRCFEVMNELRPNLRREEFLGRMERQRTQGYILAYLEADNQVHSVTGYRFLEFLAWGKVLYIDDLITREASRGKGWGGALLDWTIAQGKARGCDAIHLDTGYHRHNAHRVYLNHGFQFSSFHMAKTLKD